MAWTTLTFSFGSLLTSTKMTQIQDNLTALAQGLSGAPTILNAAMGSGSIKRANLSTGTQTQSGTIPAGPNGNVYITMNAYSFFPMIHNLASNDQWFLRGHATDGASADSPRIGFGNNAAGTGDYDLDNRYVIA